MEYTIKIWKTSTVKRGKTANDFEKSLARTVLLLYVVRCEVQICFEDCITYFVYFGCRNTFLSVL